MRRPDPELQARRRAEIMNAAMNRFVAQGFHRTTVQEIAADAGISMGLLYRYFANKEGLVTEVARGDRVETITRIARFGEATQLAPALTALMDNLITSAAATGVLSLSCEIAAEACRNTAIEAMVIEHEREVMNALVEALTRHQLAGRLKADLRPKQLATHLLALVDGLAWRVRLTSKEELTAVISWIAQLVEGPTVAKVSKRPRPRS